MGNKKQDAIYNQLLAAITNMQNPRNNEAQNYLTSSAIEGANFLKNGEYSQLPKGMFFNFQNPTEQLDQYKKFANVNQGGTFALAGGGADQTGRTNATRLQSKYLSDKFARDASQNYQNNVTNAAGQIQGALGQAAGAKGQTDANVINALSGLLGSQYLNKPSGWGAVLGTIGSIGSSILGNPTFKF